MARHKTFDKAEVLERALQLFHKKGYDGVGIQELVDAMGISRSSMYDTFRDKEHLFTQALELYRDQSARKVIASISQHEHPLEGIHTLFSEMLDITMGDPERKGCFIVNTTTDVCREKIGEVSDLISDNKTAFIDAIAQALEKGQNLGEVKAELDPKSAAALLYSIYSGLMANSRVAAEPSELQKPLQLAIDLFRS